ncbi:hypothetical protein V8J88_23265 [Massilia sp. W12]|uniref:hypothetical protein n=1 Tax=Massilia sp. W12 TaxID=3126507 RepID=UPI0030D5CD8E
MNPDLTQLCQILHGVSARSDQDALISVQEDDPGATLRKIHIEARGGNWFAFSPDRASKTHAMLKPGAALVSPLLQDNVEGCSPHRVCDCVIVYTKAQGAKAGGLEIVYLDLKSGDGKGGYAGQFKSTRAFVHYALSLQQNFYRSEKPQLKIGRERFILLCGGMNLRKQNTGLAAAGKSAPDDACKIAVKDGETLYLKHLLEY